MRVELYPDTDTLSISFLAPGTVAHEGTDSGDPDVTFLWDGQGRIAEIVIERASERVDLAELRRRVSYEEVSPARAA